MTDPLEKEKTKLKKLVRELGSIKGRHTELVTVYVPAGYNLNEMINTLRNEQSTAINIKSKAVRKNVTAALDKIIQYLGNYRKTPPNGLAVFCGNVAEKEGQTDIKLWALEPPEPLRARLYWCFQQFDLRPLEEMVAEREIYGIILIDRSEADVALLKGKKIESLFHADSLVPGKSRAGGQSSARFARVREGLKHDWFKQVTEAANKIFSDHPEILGIMISGPGPTKEEFLKEELLHAEVKKKILGTVDTSYTGDHGLSETVERGQDLIRESAVVKEKNLLQRFFMEVQKPGGLAVYGLDETVNAVNRGIVEEVLASEKVEFVEIEYECHERKKIYAKRGERPQACNECNRAPVVIGEKELEDALMDASIQFGTKITIVSADTREGQQFLAFGGIGGFLRYRA
ncbi:MAG: peptide chain release factor aRF-1 [Candidatus Aenigmarchaeota archaeon]|nr:peptide chain release factor aRF-1 [Candidatus Aenigmarchaeota archaeon]